jgi:glycerophosphoryl diester phosphodiesterase
MRDTLRAQRKLVALILSAGALALAVSASGAPLNVGHRGYSAAYPENTLIAIDAAFDAGADMVEIDLQKAAGGEVVILHDDTVNRTTTGPWTGPVANLTLAQLAELEAGSWFAPEFYGEPIPLLEEGLLEGQGRGPLLLDQKSGLFFAAEIAAAVVSTGFSTSDLWVTAWDAAQVADIRAIPALDDVRILFTSSITLSSATIPSFLDDMEALGVDGISIVFENYLYADPTLVTQTQARGLLAYGWNLSLVPDTPEKMQAAIDLGLDGFIVNDVATFAAIIPEPGTALLLATGLTSLAAGGRRRSPR